MKRIKVMKRPLANNDTAKLVIRNASLSLDVAEIIDTCTCTGEVRRRTGGFDVVQQGVE